VRRGRITLVPWVAAVGVALAATACGEPAPGASGIASVSGPGARLSASGQVSQAAKDSALAQAGPETRLATPLSSAVVEIHEGDRAVVTVASASTSRGEQVAVQGVITQLLFSCVGGCGTSESDNVGISTTIGPAPADGTLEFILPLAAGGTGLARVSGAYPSYTVEMDDGLVDRDFNDVVLSVEITPAKDDCDLFQGPVSDPLLQNNDIQKALFELFQDSHPDAPNVHDRVEMAGYIVEQDGKLGFVPAGSNQSPQICSSTFTPSDLPAGAKLEGFVHTHPHDAGDPLPADGSCLGKSSGRFGDGASDADVAAALNSSVPTYVVDRDHVHRLPPFFNNSMFGTAADTASFVRNPNANCQ